MVNFKYSSLFTLCFCCLLAISAPSVLAHTDEADYSPKQYPRIEDTSVDRNEIVNIPDPALKAAINAELGQSSGADITKGQLRSFTGILYLDHKGITNITGLEECVNLVGLDLSYNDIQDLSPLASLSKLTNLYLENNQIQDLSPLASLNKLQELHLSHNTIRNVSPLHQLVHLQMLHLADNEIVDISSLNTLSNLTELTLDHNQIYNISGLSNLTNLITLTLDRNQIEDISALATLINLNALDLSYNQIKIINALASLTRLSVLYLDYNQINDLSALSSLINLTKLGLSNNSIQDISPLMTLTKLTELNLMQQRITLSGLNVFSGENAHLLNPIHDLDSAFITPVTISNNGYYEETEHTINWLNVWQAQYESFTFEQAVSLGAASTLFSGQVMIPLQFNGNTAPILIIDDPLQLELNQLFDPMDYVTAYDEEDGDITEWIQLKENTIDLTQIGMYRLTFEVTDSYGSTTSKTVTVQVGPRIAPETGLSSILLPLGALSIGTGICLKRRKK